MVRRALVMLAFSLALGIVYLPYAVFAEEEEQSNQETITGVVKSIAEDGSSIVLNDGEKDVTILTTKKFLEDSYLEVGDKVKITVEKTKQGLKAVDYSYIYEEESQSEEENYPEEEY